MHVFEQPLHLLAGECALCQIMYSLAGLFWRNDLGCASVIPSEQTASSYIILYISKAWSTSKKLQFHFLRQYRAGTSGWLATFPQLGRLQKVFNRISRANIVTSVTRNISKACSAPAKKLIMKVNLTLPLEVDQTTTMYSWREPSPIAILFCCQAWIGADYEKRALFFS